MPGPISLAVKAGPYGALATVSLIAWHFDARAVANAALVRSQAAAFEQTQLAATQIAQTALQHQQAAYAAKSLEADSAYQAQLANTRSAADRYIASHRVQPQTIASGGSSTAATAPGGSASVPAGVPTGAVVVSTGDVQACTDAATYALNAHTWAANINP
ncbi:hypothetical protein [Novosphingobium sp.]|uniref:hypothetical protein n=1 Tax=Novosphingobium sp. TaxID=1874826 RepID=UPI003B521953